MQACRMIQLVFDIFQERHACYSQTTCLHVSLYLAWVFEGLCCSETTGLLGIVYCSQTTSCCSVRTVHIMSSLCNHDCEHIMIDHVDNCFDSAVYQISQFHQFSQFVNYAFSI